MRTVEPSRKVVDMTSALPARPDLTHLRDEAKLLLRRLRAGDREALARMQAQARDLEVTLSTAQLVIAREYGFASWAQMKALVTRMSSGGVRYDTIGLGYSIHRRPDPRIARSVHDALGDARTVVNVGAGTGSYEPADRPVIPIEPSTAMALQRDPALPPAVLGVAESLPMADGTADASMAMMTMHHWSDLGRGLAELHRVTRKRIVILTIDPEVGGRMWLLQHYVPEIAEGDKRDFPAIARLVEQLGPSTRVQNLPVPADCTDGFGLALWNRPEAILDPAVRAATSGFARMDKHREEAAVSRLGRDLETGEWDRRYGHLRAMNTLDVGLRLVVAELS
jgi:SAM-dependent methyltransferase